MGRARSATAGNSLKDLVSHVTVQSKLLKIPSLCITVSLESTVLLKSLTLDVYLQVWYFGPNIGHAILGLEPSGCTYLTGEPAAHPAAIVNRIMSRDALLEVPVLSIYGCA